MEKSKQAIDEQVAEENGEGSEKKIEVKKEKPENDEKSEVPDFKIAPEDKQTCIQDHPCLYYTYRHRGKNGLQIRGFPRTHLCKVCEEEYNEDSELFERRNFRGSTKYFDESGIVSELNIRGNNAQNLPYLD